MRFDIKKIKECQLCIGCGACESFIPNAKMEINKEGFIVPNVTGNIDKPITALLGKICPGINIDCVKPDKSLFGKTLGVFEGWAKDPIIRHHASSGGIISALCCYLLENKIVDGIIQVRRSQDHYMFNTVCISKTTKDVFECAASRYAPVSMFKNIRDLLEQDDSVYAFVGKPCDIMTITRILDNFPKWEKRIKYKISLVCAGIPSFNATQKLVDKGKENPLAKPISVKYRGDGWPGKFKIEYDDNSCFELNYNESWGDVLGRNLGFRCKICPDGIGQYADIVVGDSWDTKDGYPDFKEQDGRCFILVRTLAGQQLLIKAQDNSYVSFKVLDINKLPEIQPYQYHRLLYASYKLIGAKICLGGILRIHNINIIIKVFSTGIRVILGTIKRFRKNEPII